MISDKKQHRTSINLDFRPHFFQNAYINLSDIASLLPIRLTRADGGNF